MIKVQRRFQNGENVIDEYLQMLVTLTGLANKWSLFLIGLEHGFVAVAAEIAAGGRAVLLPRIQAHPAEIKLALAALHVITAFVLLDEWLAVGARLAIRHQPVAVSCLLALRTRRLQFLRFDRHDFVQPL